MLQRRRQCRLVKRLKLAPRHQARSFALHKGQATGDALGGQPVVAGDHHDADASAPTFGDRLGHFGARRVVHRHEAQKDQFLLDLFVAAQHTHVRQGAHCQAEDAQPGAGKAIFRRPKRHPLLGIQRHRLSTKPDVGAARQHLIGRTLHIHRRRRCSVDGAHQFAARLERHLVDTRRRQCFRFQIKPALPRHHQQRRLRRIAENRPAGRFVSLRRIGRQQPRIIAECARPQQQRHIIIWRYREQTPISAERADRRVAAAFHFNLAAACPKVAHRHRILGERAGLVGANDPGASQRLNGGKPLDQGVPLRHALHANRK